jgi:hypothetical protein
MHMTNYLSFVPRIAQAVLAVGVTAASVIVFQLAMVAG